MKAIYAVLVKKFEREVAEGQLIIRLWKDGDNTYHLKGIWVDDNYILLTGNNLNPRAWRLDAENGLFIHDPQHQLRPASVKRTGTHPSTHYSVKTLQ